MKQFAVAAPRFRLLLVASCFFLLFPTLARAATVYAAAYGYTTADATSALQAAIDSGADTVIVEKMSADWFVDPIWLTRSNQTIVFEDGVNVVAKSGSFHGTYDCLFRADAETNLTLSGYGATFQMRKSDYTSGEYTDSEFRHALRLAGCSNVTVEGLTIKDTGGDGVVLISYNEANPWCQDVVVKDVVFDNNYRQGMSICSAKNLLVDNCIFHATSGTPPAAGIDIEPDKIFERVDNCTIQNTIIHDNAPTHGGLTLALNNFGGEPFKDAVIDINHCTIVGNGNAGMWLWNKTSGLTVRNSIFASNYSYGVCQIYDDYGALSIGHSAFYGNRYGATRTANVAPTCVTGVDPRFVSTDVNNPYYMYLAKDCPASISLGASDGTYMGARPAGFLPGDANLDGVVDDWDASIVGSHWLAGGATWSDGDFNGDGLVNDCDAAILAGHWHAVAGESSHVPEPTTLAGLMSLLAALLLAAGKQKHQALY